MKGKAILILLFSLLYSCVKEYNITKDKRHRFAVVERYSYLMDKTVYEIEKRKVTDMIGFWSPGKGEWWGWATEGYDDEKENYRGSLVKGIGIDYEGMFGSTRIIPRNKNPQLNVIPELKEGNNALKLSFHVFADEEWLSEGRKWFVYGGKREKRIEIGREHFDEIEDGIYATKFSFWARGKEFPYFRIEKETNEGIAYYQLHSLLPAENLIDILRSLDRKR